MADNVSIMGTIKISTGKASVMIVLDLKPMIDIVETMNPKNSEPQSPINILAGWQLYTRKPKNAAGKNECQRHDIKTSFDDSHTANDDQHNNTQSTGKAI